MKFRLDKQSINRQSTLLGGALNILVVIVAIMLYNAYIVQPRIEEMQSKRLTQELENTSSSSPFHSLSTDVETSTQKSVNK